MQLEAPMTELVTSEDGSPVGDVEEGLGDERGLVIHHPAEEQPYRCPLCGQTFSQQPSLVRHQKAHAGAGRTAAFVCPECGPSFWLGLHVLILLCRLLLLGAECQS